MCHRNLLIIIFIILVMFSFFYFQPLQAPTEAVTAVKKAPFVAGEKIIYDVKIGPLKMGTSQLSFLGKTKIGKKKVLAIVFETTGFNFLDIEKIFVEEKTFYPVRVERVLNLWGRKMDIVEDYDSKDFSWRLTKREGSKISQEVFKNDSRVQNIISVVYYYRQLGNYAIDKPIEFNFSSVKVKMAVKKIVAFTAGGKVYQAYLLESVPRKYRVWLDTGERKLPLRIDGPIGFGLGNTAMIVKESN
jgi:hypothetical protein